MENPSSSGGRVEAQWDIPSSRKRSRRSGWDVEEPVKVMKASHDLHFKQPNDSSLSVLGNQNRVSSAGAAVSAATAAPLSSFLPSTSISLPTTIPSVANMPAITAQVLAQQALAKSGLVVGLLSAPKLENRIYVGSLHYSLRETDIIALFSVFGPVVKCDMSYDQVLGRSKGFCFVEFQDQVTAQTAMTMDGFELAGRKIKVGRPSHVQINPNGPQIGTLIPSVTRQFNSQAASQVAASTTVPQLWATLPSNNAAAPAPSQPDSSFVLIRNIRTSIGLSEVQELFSLHGSVKCVKQLRSIQLDPVLYYDVLLEFQEGGSVASQAVATMNGYTLSKSQLVVEAISLSRAVELMIQKVESTTAQSAKTVILEDMVTKEDMNDPGLKDEIAEVAGNYGTLDSIDISLNASEQQVIVKLIYAEPIQAIRACKAIHGRGFAGRKIRASILNQN